MMNLVVGILCLFSVLINAPFWQDPIAILLMSINFPLALINLVMWWAFREPVTSGVRKSGS
jgi:hypothetical protein